MKICYLIPFMPPDYAGGGRRAYNQVKHIAKQGHDITIITFTNRTETNKNIRIINLSIPAYSKPNLHGQTLNKITSLPKLLWKMINILKFNKFDLIHCIVGANSTATLIALLASFLTKTKITIGTTLAYEDDPLTIKNSKFGKLKFALMNRANAIICISPLIYSLAEESGLPHNLIHLIPNSVSIEKFSMCNQIDKEKLKYDLGINSFKHILLNIGILHPRKNTIEVIEVFREILKGEPDSCLVIAGPLSRDNENIEYSTKIKTLINEYGLNRNVVLTGEVNNVREWMAISDVFLFASKAEGLPNVLLESMASGLPIVTMDIPATTDFLIDNCKDGYIVKNREQFIEKVILLIKNEDLRKDISVKARTKVATKFSDENICELYLNLYKTI